MKFKLLTFVFVAIFSQMLFAEKFGKDSCENEAGKCLYEEGVDDILCNCVDYDKDDFVHTQGGVDEALCSSTLEDICGTTVPKATELCDTSEKLDKCKEYTLTVGRCFDDYTQDDIDAFEDGGWSGYSRDVTSCCYAYVKGEAFNEDMVEVQSCVEENGCVEECLGYSQPYGTPSDDDESSSEQDDSSNETSNTEESESSDSDGCSVLMI